MQEDTIYWSKSMTEGIKAVLLVKIFDTEIHTWIWTIFNFFRFTLKYLDHLVGFRSSKPISWPSRKQHGRYGFFETYHEIADQGFCCFLPYWYSWAFWAQFSKSYRNLLSSIFIFPVLTLLMFMRYLGSELYKRGTNTVIAFSCWDCAGFLFVLYSIKHVFHVLGDFWFVFCVLWWLSRNYFCVIWKIISMIFILNFMPKQ